MDEKGFLQGFAHAVKRVMTRKEYESQRVRSNRQDGSREFITLLAAICADGTAIPPALIYKGVSGDLMDTWVEDVGEGDKAFFGSSSAGWSNNEFGHEWLVKVFDPSTATKTRGRRLLVVDGHSSHVNMKFLDTCNTLRIVVLVLPPHATHRLQPLDVGLFGPLASSYSFEINEIMRKSGGLSQLSKRNFWACFQKAWEASFTCQNIQSAFQKTGYWPLNPNTVLDVIRSQAQPITPPPLDYLKTPKTSKAIRRFQKEYTKNPSPRKLDKLFKANEALAAETSIQLFRAQGLQEALQLEKKKRRRGKRLGLGGKEIEGAQLFGVPEILKAREVQANIEAEKVRLEAEKEQSKLDKAVQKALEKQEKEDRKIQREINTQVRKEAKERAKADKSAAKSGEKSKGKAVVVSQKALIVILIAPPVFLASLGSTKAIEVELQAAQRGVVSLPSRPARSRKLPQRFSR
jgi:hypothetical protein